MTDSDMHAQLTFISNTRMGIQLDNCDFSHGMIAWRVYEDTPMIHQQSQTQRSLLSQMFCNQKPDTTAKDPCNPVGTKHLNLSLV